MDGEKRIALDPRLSMIAEMVGRCSSYADVGCDHGRLGASLLQKDWVDRAVLTDISAPSLDKARALIRLLGLKERTKFVVCDGVDGLDEPVDAVVIAGMGGTTAAGIVERGREKLGDARLILQANVAIAELRTRLGSAGYRITDERIVRDGRRHYIGIEARPGAMALIEREAVIGPVLLQKRPAELGDYARFRIRVAAKALEGARKGGDAETAAALEREKRIWEDLEACL